MEDVLPPDQKVDFTSVNRLERAVGLGTITHNKDCEDINVDKCAQTLISDDVSLRRYAASVRDALYVADVCFDFKAAVLWTADHADTMLEICMLCCMRRSQSFFNKHNFVRTKSGFNSVRNLTCWNCVIGARMLLRSLVFSPKNALRLWN